MIHLVPYDGIGGVESAARTMANAKHRNFCFDVEYIFPRRSLSYQRLSTFNPLGFLFSAYRIFCKKPDLLIVSLWRSCIVGLIVKILNPRLPLVLFLHLPEDVHLLDRIFTRLTRKIALQVWSDSDATLQARFPDLSVLEGRVISFLTKRLQPNDIVKPTPKFLFWGRLHPQKGLQRAIKLFAHIKDVHPAAQFTVIGPDGGEFAQLCRLVNELSLSASVKFCGSLDLDEIIRQSAGASFYLQTSFVEGMAMSVVESMQLGLVPVVTPVGQIAHYCLEGHNALFVDDKNSCVEKVSFLLDNAVEYHRLRSNAIETWHGKPLYSEAVLAACADLLADTR